MFLNLIFIVILKRSLYLIVHDIKGLQLIIKEMHLSSMVDARVNVDGQTGGK